MSVNKDLEIVQSAEMLPIQDIAKKLNLDLKDLEPYGHYKAKINTHQLELEASKKGHLILVTALSPTPAGEGKTTVTIGLNDALNALNKNAIAVIREPSLGPVFGIKGGAAGGGYSQVIPMEDLNLHFTGDFNAIEKANNLLASVIDNNIQSKTHNLGLDPRTIKWKRVIDLNDRALRQIVIGLGGTPNGIPREDGFNITAASEIMAILCLAKDLEDLKTKLGAIFIGYTFDKKPIYARDLKVVGAMALLLKDAIHPNLVQTLEHNPVLVHGGPFANIAQGTNSVIATRLGLQLSDYVVTEAGFGADLGAEKFFNIKCAHAGLQPALSVLVCTVRALRSHGGVSKENLSTPDPKAVAIGVANLKQHIENLQQFKIPVLVAINQFIGDDAAEYQIIQDACAELGVSVALNNTWAEGSKGGLDLGRKVIEICEENQGHFTPLYQSAEMGILEKIEHIAKNIYRAKGVNLSAEAEKQLKEINSLGLDHLPVCMAKTQYSFSDDPTKINVAKDFTIFIKSFEIASGAGFIVPILGKIMRMPGLPAIPASEGMDIDEKGQIFGLS